MKFGYTGVTRGALGLILKFIQFYSTVDLVLHFNIKHIQQVKQIEIYLISDVLHMTLGMFS